MKKLLSTLIGVCLFFLLNALNAQNYQDSLTHYLTQHSVSANLPGFAVAVVTENGVVYRQGFGWTDLGTKKTFTPATILNWGSVSKTIVGLALAKAIESGALSMETPINNVLPFRIVHPRHREIPILVRHLATHRSGIIDGRHYGKSYVVQDDLPPNDNYHTDYLGFIRSHENMSLEAFLRRALSKEGEWYTKKNFAKYAPGEGQEYANLNAALMGLIVENATGKPFVEFCQELIFIPLSMTTAEWGQSSAPDDQKATRYFPAGKVVPPYRLVTYPDGGLHASVNDMANFLREMIRAFAGKSEYLPAEFARQMLPGDEDELRMFWGMGTKSRNIGHGGSDPGVQSDLQFNADTRIGRIILTNVNAEDNAEMYEQYRQIHQIIARFEDKL